MKHFIKKKIIKFKFMIKKKLFKNILNKFPERGRFCPLPFKHMEIQVGGRTNLCCYLNKSPGIVKENNLFEIYNSKSAQSGRRSMISGTLEYCDLNVCPHFTGGTLPINSNCIGTPYEKIINESITKLNKLNLWLAFDSRCNLSCPSCRKDIIKCSKPQIAEMEMLMSEVKKNLSRISNLGISGNGDPFASPVYRKFLFEFDAKVYPDVKIFILSNGQLFNENAWGSMSKAQSAIKSVQFSIDAATKESYEKIRRGGCFNKIKSNLEFISSLRKTNKIDEFIISFVVSANNYMEMADFIRWGKSLECDQVYFSYMINPGVFSNDEYETLAIHLLKHPLHRKFKTMLEDKLFDDPIVMLGNIKQYKPAKVLRDSLFS